MVSNADVPFAAGATNDVITCANTELASPRGVCEMPMLWCLK